MDPVLQEKLKGAVDPEAATALAMESGFDVSCEDWLIQRSGEGQPSEEELEGVAGGGVMTNLLVCEYRGY